MPKSISCFRGHVRRHWNGTGDPSRFLDCAGVPTSCFTPGHGGVEQLNAFIKERVPRTRFDDTYGTVKKHACIFIHQMQSVRP